MGTAPDQSRASSVGECPRAGPGQPGAHRRRPARRRGCWRSPGCGGGRVQEPGGSGRRRASCSDNPASSIRSSVRYMTGTCSSQASTTTGTSHPDTSCAWANAARASTPVHVRPKYAGVPHCDHPRRPAEGTFHRRHEVDPGRPFPRVQLDRVPGARQLLADPLRPRRVRPGMRNEEVAPSSPVTPPSLARPPRAGVHPGPPLLSHPRPHPTPGPVVTAGCRRPSQRPGR